MNPKELFLNTKPFKLFLTAALPGSISMLFSAVYALIDGILVGNYLPSTAFAALNLAFPFIIINFALADLIGVGSSVPIAISLGQKNEAQANNVFTCSLIMIFVGGAVSGALMYLAAPLLIGMMGAEGEFKPLAVGFMRVYAAFSPLTTVTFALDNYLRICGKVRLSMFLNIGMAVIGCALEFLFLAVWDLGLDFSALAFCLAMLLVSAVGIVPFLLGKLQLRFVRPRFTWDMVRRIVANGCPTFLNNISGRVTAILFNLVLVRLGGEMGVSIYGVLMYVEGVIQPLLYGMCDSLQPAVSYNLGAGRRDRVKAIEKCCFTASAALSLVSVAVMLLIPDPITRLFMVDITPEGLNVAITAVRLFALPYLTRWFSFAAQSYLLAVEKPVQATIISVMVVCGFPLMLIPLMWPLGMTGLWLNFPVTSVLTAILAWIILRGKRIRETLG